jgi:hypothetical protein
MRHTVVFVELKCAEPSETKPIPMKMVGKCDTKNKNKSKKKLPSLLQC